MRISTNGVGVEALCAEALSSLSAAVSQAVASALTRGIVELCCAGTQFHGSSCSASSHPMVRALRAHRDAGAALLDATASKLSAGGPREFDAMKRFIMRSLLEHPAPPPRSAFPSLLHARLMAVVSGNGKNANSVLKLCVQAFGAYRSPTSEAQVWIATVAGDIVDAIECRLYEFDEQDVLALVPSEHLSANEIVAARLADQAAVFNPQQQFRVSWPAEPWRFRSCGATDEPSCSTP